MTNLKNTARYLISTVAQRSGVKSERVRAWKHRYQAATPTRTEGGHRVYTDQDIAHLKLLNPATRDGHSTRQIARYSLVELKTLPGNDAVAYNAVIVGGQAAAHYPTALIEACVRAIQSYALFRRTLDALASPSTATS